MSARFNNLAAVIFFAFGCLMIAASVNLYYSLDAARAVVPFVLAGVAFFGAAASWKDAQS